jgi:hypothetical protein
MNAPVQIPTAALPARAIAAFYRVSATWTVVSFALVKFGFATLGPDQASHFTRSSPVKLGLSQLTAGAEFE